jgi:hypothetical protein
MTGRTQTRRAPQYQWLVQERNGDVLVDALDLHDRALYFPLNRVPEASGTLRTRSTAATVEALTPGTTELIVYRDGIPLETVFQLAGAGAEADEDRVRLSTRWQGILSYLKHGLILAEKNFSNQEQSRIPWGMINDFQGRAGADYAITDGGAPAGSPSKSAGYAEDTEILEAIQRLSERADGFDYSITPQRAFQTYYPQRGTDKSATVVLEYGTHIAGFDLDVSTEPGAVTTDLRVWGGEGTLATAANSTSRATYLRREASITYSDVITDPSALQQHATALIERRSLPRRVPSIRLHANLQEYQPLRDYWLGDIVTVRVRAGRLFDLDEPFRIIGIRISLDENSNEQIELQLNRVGEGVEDE